MMIAKNQNLICWFEQCIVLLCFSWTKGGDILRGLNVMCERVSDIIWLVWWWRINDVLTIWLWISYDQNRNTRFELYMHCLNYPNSYYLWIINSNEQWSFFVFIFYSFDSMNTILSRLTPILLNKTIISTIQYPLLHQYLQSTFILHSHRSFSTSKLNSYVCNSCGSKYMRWQGQCPVCKEWNTITEQEHDSIEPTNRIQSHLQKTNDKSHSMKTVSIQDLKGTQHLRYQLSSKEINRVFGGGLVKDSVTLIGGEPGIGKSTFLLQLCNDLCSMLMMRKPSKDVDSCHLNVLYVSGEENMNQIYIRSNRLNTLSKSLYISHETNLDTVLNYLQEHAVYFWRSRMRYHRSNIK